jgi:hypothetical protein
MLQKCPKPKETNKNGTLYGVEEGSDYPFLILYQEPTKTISKKSIMLVKNFCLF